MPLSRERALHITSQGYARLQGYEELLVSGYRRAFSGAGLLFLMSLLQFPSYCEG